MQVYWIYCFYLNSCNSTCEIWYFVNVVALFCLWTDVINKGGHKAGYRLLEKEMNQTKHLNILNLIINLLLKATHLHFVQQRESCLSSQFNQSCAKFSILKSFPSSATSNMSALFNSVSVTPGGIKWVQLLDFLFLGFYLWLFSIFNKTNCWQRTAAV